MREIKFRAWSEYDKKMLYLPSFRDWLTGKANFSWGWMVDDFPIMQYTGLKDKNGKEGYFDDLVKWGKAIYKLVWNEDEGIAALQYISGREVFKYLRISQIKKGEIIGNIYSNPELLDLTK